MEEKITLLEAYKTMITFLDDYYTRFGQDSLSSVLGAIDLMPDGNPVDPAAWFDWLEAVKKTLDEKDK
jgi:N-acetyl-anhydromuramyl-L-alanine amidase AmpD